METTRRPQDLCGIAFSEAVGWEERLGAATELIRELKSLQKELGAAGRTEKASWKRIGDALGVSPQAAQQRFEPKPKRVPERLPQEKVSATPVPQQKDQSASTPTQEHVPTPTATVRGAGELKGTERNDPLAPWGYTAWIGRLPVVRVERVLERPVLGARRGRWGRRALRA